MTSSALSKQAQASLNHPTQSLNLLTLFPEAVTPYFQFGVTGRAINRGVIDLHCVNFRDYAEGNYKAVDDLPFGGGAGMVIQAEPVAKALDDLIAKGRNLGTVIMLAPTGRVFTQADAERLSQASTLTFICGRYEGIDARLNIEYVNEVFSIGDYILSGGELAAMVMIDAIARLKPGVLNNAESATYESHSAKSGSLLEHPHYTRPATWRGHSVPSVLMSGHHARIQAWRREESLKTTARVRPELLENIDLTPEECSMLEQIRRGE